MYLKYLSEYIELVENGQILVGEKMKLNTTRLKNMINSEEYIKDDKQVERAVFFIENFCKHYEGEYFGQNFKLNLWQKAFIASIFGFYKEFEYEILDENGVLNDNYEVKRLRVFKEVTLIVGSGNGKSTLAGAIITYIMFGLNVNAPKCYIASNTKEQSAITFDYAKNMVKQNNELLRNCRIIESRHKLYVQNGMGICYPMSSNKKGHEGINASFIVIDEIHEMKQDNVVYDLKKSIKRKDLLILEISTQGKVRGGYIDDRLEYIDKVLKDELTDERLNPWIFEQDSEEELYENPKNAQKSNPQLGSSVTVIDIEEKINKAKSDFVQKRTILSKNFNIPQTSTSVFFTENECTVNSYDENMLFGSSGFIGLDNAYTNDLGCLTYI